jgi:hypothetical protein
VKIRRSLSVPVEQHAGYEVSKFVKTNKDTRQCISKNENAKACIHGGLTYQNKTTKPDVGETMCKK